MPSHRYERVPLVDDTLSHDPTYRSGIPSTAPPSFHSVALSASDFPHKNDENTATVMPALPERSEAEDPALSVWAPSENLDLESQREDVIVQLMGRVEELERRLDSQSSDKELDVQPKRRELVWRERFEYWGAMVAATTAMVWLMAVVVLSILVSYRKAGVKDH